MPDDEQKDTPKDASDDGSEAASRDAGADDADETGADAQERDAKEELFEAIDHFKSAANILFDRARKDPAVKTATNEVKRVAREVGDAAEPLAQELTAELSRLTKDVMRVVDRSTKRSGAARSEGGDEEE